MLKIDDGLISAQKSTAQKYRDQMFVLYNSPFIWNAPEEKDLDKWRKDLWRPLEVFLWADWANHRDANYWIKRILAVTDDKSAPDEDADQELGISVRSLVGLPNVGCLRHTLPSMSRVTAIRWGTRCLHGRLTAF